MYTTIGRRTVTDAFILYIILGKLARGSDFWYLPLSVREARELRDIRAVNWRLEETTVELPMCSGLARNEPQMGKQRITCEGSIRCYGS
jgi:hypothetical protein